MATEYPKLLLSLEGDKIPSGKFLEAAKSFFSLLDEVAADMSGKRSSVKWSVSVEPGSVVLAAEPMDQYPNVPVRKVMGRVNAGLRELEKSPRRPDHFSDEALKHLRSLAQVTEHKRVTGASVRIRRGDKETKPTKLRKTSRHIDDILRPTFRDYGTIEGFLETISIHDSAYFSLYDILTDQAVRCQVEEDHLDEAWRLLRARRRVAVSGFITYLKTGRPTSIAVEMLESIGANENLPASEVYGILGR